jgi:O-antigen ligase
MMGAAIVVSLWALVGYLANWGIPHPWNVAISAGRRAVGPFGFPNAVALFVAPIGALAAARFAGLIANRKADATKQQTKFSLKEFVLPLLTLVSVALALVLAKSDGGMIAFGFVIVLALLGLRWGRWLVLLGAVLAAAALALLPEVRQAIVQELTFQGWSGKVRLIMWRETWTMLKDHWFFGAGFGGYPTVFDAYHKARFIEIFQYPHTILFNLWSETGLLGIAAFVGVALTWFYQSLLASRRLVGAVGRRGLVYAEHLVLLAPLLAILVQGLVDVPYFKNDLALLFWLFVWLVLAAKQETPKLA